MISDHRGQPLGTGRAAVNGTSLHYRTGGFGPALVLLHGVPKTSYHWRHLIPKLTDRYTVVAPDLRGLGDSARPADGYDSATMSDDIAALMAHLGHETYAVVGEDWGAVVGYQLAARHRDHVRALVFAEALPRVRLRGPHGTHPRERLQRHAPVAPGLLLPAGRPRNADRRARAGADQLHDQERAQPPGHGHPRRHRGVRALLLHARGHPGDAGGLPRDAGGRRTEPRSGTEEAGHTSAGARRLGLHRRAERGDGTARGPRRDRTGLHGGARPRRGGPGRDGRRGAAVPGRAPVTGGA
ncbi:alpha/beta fold hydrolase [Streptomyces albus]